MGMLVFGGGGAIGALCLTLIGCKMAWARFKEEEKKENRRK